MNKVWFQATQSPPLQWIRFYSMLPYLGENIEAPEFKVDDENVFWEAEMDKGNPDVAAHFEHIIESGYKVVIIQRVFRMAGLAIIDLLQQNGVKVITEIDDGLDLNISHPAYHHWVNNRGYEIAIEQLKMSNGIYVSTDYLKRQFQKYNANIAVISNTIDRKYIKHHYANAEILKIKNRVNDGKIKIVYMGSSSHDGDIESIYEPLLQFANDYSDFVEVELLGGCVNFAKRKDAIIKTPSKHNIHDYYTYLSEKSPHIGLAPLVKHDFNLCKSNLRFVEYSSLGAVTLASNIGDFKKPIADGVCFGFDNKNPNDFYKQLKNILEYGKLNIEKLGKNAKEYAEETYNTKAEASKLQHFIDNI